MEETVIRLPGSVSQKVAQINVGFFLNRGGHITGFAVELVDRDHLSLGDVVGQSLAGGVDGL